MPVFEYSALNIKGKNVSGIIDAESALSARQKLRASEMFPVSLNEVVDTGVRESVRVSSLSRFFSRVKPTEISIMTRQLATLINAGFPLVSAIDTLVPQTRSPAFKKILARLKDAIVEGKSFADALSLYPGIFSPLYINMVRAGESSGTLELILDRLAEIGEKQIAISNRIKTAMIYPVLMSVVGAIVLFILMAFIVPNITSIFDEMDQVLPAPTRLLIGISDIFQAYWWAALIAFPAVILLLKMMLKTERGRRLRDRSVLSLPLFGDLIRKLAVARFARTLGSLLENGVSMLPALGIVKNIVGNTLIAEKIEAASEDVEKGQGLAQSLSTGTAIPYLAVQMIGVGEQTGTLESMLTKIADVFESEAESQVMRLTTLLEPLMILAMAVVVGFIVLSICLPIFEMNQLIK